RTIYGVILLCPRLALFAGTCRVKLRHCDCSFWVQYQQVGEGDAGVDELFPLGGLRGRPSRFLLCSATRGHKRDGDEGGCGRHEHTLENVHGRSTSLLRCFLGPCSVGTAKREGALTRHPGVHTVTKTGGHP